MSKVLRYHATQRFGFRINQFMGKELGGNQDSWLIWPISGTIVKLKKKNQPSGQSREQLRKGSKREQSRVPISTGSSSRVTGTFRLSSSHIYLIGCSAKETVTGGLDAFIMRSVRNRAGTYLAPQSEPGRLGKQARLHTSVFSAIPAAYINTHDRVPDGVGC